MTSTVTKGLIVAAIHVALAGSLGAKLVVDRTNYPRAWARTAPIDPDLPIRGRYVRLRLEAQIGADLNLDPPPAVGPNRVALGEGPARRISLDSDDGALVARASTSDDDPFASRVVRGGAPVAALMTPVAFFIPEHVPDPSIRPAGEELWVEVTIPPHGAPRPIRLAVKKDGVLTALELD